jgi:transposase-like protein
VPSTTSGGAEPRRRAGGAGRRSAGHLHAGGPGAQVARCRRHRPRSGGCGGRRGQVPPQRPGDVAVLDMRTITRSLVRDPSRSGNSGPSAVPIVLSEDERAELVRRAGLPGRRQADRARIILACAAGMSNAAAARELGVAVKSVSKWRRQFAAGRLAGLEDAAPFGQRRGRTGSRSPPRRARRLGRRWPGIWARSASCSRAR